MNRKDRVSIRLTPYQYQVLTELSTALDTSISMMIRTIIGDFLTKNEDALERIIERKLEGDANYQQNRKTEEIFGEEGN